MPPPDGERPEAARERTVIRPYRVEDRPAVRRICADTGFLGRPIDPVFEDRELFADYLTSYYTDAEPESTMVCTLSGEVQGYIMGCRFPREKKRFEARLLPSLAVRGVWRLLTRPYNAASRRYIWWILTQSRRESPSAPSDVPHIHFNILPEAQSVTGVRLLVSAYLEYLCRHGEKQVYGQVVSLGARRGERLFARYGFRVVDQREITKYQAFHPGTVRLLTVVKDLTEHPHIYGLDLHKSRRPS